MSERALSPLDRCIAHFDKTLKICTGQTPGATREVPGQDLSEGKLSTDELRHSAGLMRVNHVGEVCAQALYQGQALTARDETVKAQMAHSAQEEIDHLAWCEDRLQQLGGRVSWGNPLWYAGAFAIGAAAGLCGDKWSLGFVVETERQVEQHLASHLDILPAQDVKSRVVVQQMQADEVAHGEAAMAQGAAELPTMMKKLMGGAAKLMTKTAYYV